MDLFNSDEEINILPYDGNAIYHGQILSNHEALLYFERLFESIEWEHDEAIIMGKRIVTKRKVAWYGNSVYSYTYSGVTKQSKIWTEELLELKSIVENISGNTFNSCLLNLYHSGEEGMAYHSDNEKSLDSCIASLSLGAIREFSFKHKKTKLRIPIVLEKGSLLLMKDDTQIHWMHRLAPTKKVKTPRINLTFRTIIKT